MEDHVNIDYTGAVVKRNSAHRAARAAVVRPLLGFEQSRDDAAVAAMTAIRKLWQYRLGELKQANWAFLCNEAGKKNLIYARSCPPYGMLTSSMHMRRCRRAMICPFCYARDYVYRNYNVIADFLFAGKEKGQRADVAGRKLVAFRTRLEVTVKPWTPVELHTACLAARRYISDPSRRWLEMLLCQAEVGAVQFRLYPGPRQETTGKLILVRSGLLVTKADVGANMVERNPHHKHNLCEVVNLEEITAVKKTLSILCGKVFAYPKPMLFAPVEDIVTILHAMKKCRMVGTYVGG